MRKIEFTVITALLSGISYILINKFLNTIQTYESLIIIVIISSVISFNTAIILDYVDKNFKN